MTAWGSSAAWSIPSRRSESECHHPDGRIEKGCGCRWIASFAACPFSPASTTLAGAPLTYGRRLRRCVPAKRKSPHASSAPGLRCVRRPMLSVRPCPSVRSALPEPWDLGARRIGGGSAAAVAAGIVPWRTATMGGGSIRVPQLLRLSASSRRGLDPSFPQVPPITSDFAVDHVLQAERGRLPPPRSTRLATRAVTCVSP